MTLTPYILQWGQQCQWMAVRIGVVGAGSAGVFDDGWWTWRVWMAGAASQCRLTAPLPA
jgi:hypothetical protein